MTPADAHVYSFMKNSGEKFISHAREVERVQGGSASPALFSLSAKFPGQVLANVQEAIALLGFEGEKANLDRVVKTSGEGWSLGEKQLVSAAASFTVLMSHVCVCAFRFA